MRPRQWTCSCAWRNSPDVATYTVLYWQEVSSQIKASDDLDDVNVPLDPRFMERIDQLAAKRGLQAADDYLAQWRWSEEQEREGTAAAVAHAVKLELEAAADW
jgi:hypothetical protein